jgi:hypothetical protein
VRLDVRPAAFVRLEYSGPLGDTHEATDVQPARPTARRSRRLRAHPLRMIGAAAALALGTHLVLTTTPLGSAVSTDAVPAAPSAAGNEEPGTPVAENGGQLASDGDVTETRTVTSEPARVPMTPGPAFAGSAPARPGADSAARASTRAAAAAPAPAPAAPAEPSAIVPAPLSFELGLPELPSDSIVPSAPPRDTMGMKKILRALNGPKPVEASRKP